MIKNLTTFSLFAIALSIPSNSNAWVNLTTHGNESYGLIGNTEVNVFIQEDIGHNYGPSRNFCERFLNVQFLQEANENILTTKLVCDWVGGADLRSTSRIVKSTISNDLHFFVIQFSRGQLPRGKFIVCHLNHSDNSIAIIYSSDTNSDLQLSLQFPTDESLVVVDQSGREIFRLNTATEESQILVRPQEKKSSGCSIM